MTIWRYSNNGLCQHYVHCTYRVVHDDVGVICLTPIGGCCAFPVTPDCSPDELVPVVVYTYKYVRLPQLHVCFMTVCQSKPALYVPLEFITSSVVCMFCLLEMRWGGIAYRTRTDFGFGFTNSLCSGAAVVSSSGCFRCVIDDV